LEFETEKETTLPCPHIRSFHIDKSLTIHGELQQGHTNIYTYKTQLTQYKKSATYVPIHISIYVCI